MTVSKNHHKHLSVFRSTQAAVDLASLMIGAIVLAIVGGVVAAVIFAVIPWTQDNAAKQNLEAVRVAQGASASGFDNNQTGFKNYDQLKGEKLLPAADTLAVEASSNHKCYVAVSESSTSKTYYSVSGAAAKEFKAGDTNPFEDNCAVSIPGVIDTLNNGRSLTTQPVLYQPGLMQLRVTPDVDETFISVPSGAVPKNLPYDSFVFSPENTRWEYRVAVADISIKASDGTVHEGALVEGSEFIISTHGETGAESEKPNKDKADWNYFGLNITTDLAYFSWAGGTVTVTDEEGHKYRFKIPYQIS